MDANIKRYIDQQVAQLRKELMAMSSGKSSEKNVSKTVIMNSEIGFNNLDNFGIVSEIVPKTEDE